MKDNVAVLSRINKKQVVLLLNEKNINLPINCLDKDVYPFKGSTYIYEENNQKQTLTLKNLELPHKKDSLSNEINESVLKELHLKINFLIISGYNYFSKKALNDALDKLSEINYDVNNLRMALNYDLSGNGLEKLLSLINTAIYESKETIKAQLTTFFERRNEAGWIYLKNDIFKCLGLVISENDDFNIFMDDITSFSLKSSSIRIYLDEAWPENSDEGIIAGIIWNGDAIDIKSLPIRQTHTNSPLYLEKDPATLLKCSKAFPFIIKTKEKIYLNLLTKVIEFILGWLLPQRGYPCEVSIFAEAFTDKSSEFYVGADLTSHFKTIISELKVNHVNRFQRWTIKQVKCVNKDFEYIAWGDLLGHFGLMNGEKVLQFYNVHKISQWLGNINLDKWLEKKLNSLENKITANDYLDLLKNSYNRENFVTLLLKKISEHVANNEEFINDLINSINELFKNKKKKSTDIEKILLYIEENIPNISETSYMRNRLKWFTYLIKNANNKGDTVKVGELLDDYVNVRRQVIENDRELVAQSDLAISVYYNDNFDFETANLQLKQLKSDQSFRFLSLFTRAKITSSYAQSLSILGKHKEAEMNFIEALDYLKKSDLNQRQKQIEITQTLTYRLTNAFDGKLSNKDELFCEMFINPQEAYLNLKNGIISNPYSVHLLLKIAYFDGKYRIFYRGLPYEYDDFNGSELNHPWQLIMMYSGLMYKSASDYFAKRCFDTSLLICRKKDQGAVVKLIGCIIQMIASVNNLNKIRPESLKIMRQFIKKELYLGLDRFKQAIEILNSNENADIKTSKLLLLLPFNYH